MTSRVLAGLAVAGVAVVVRPTVMLRLRRLVRRIRAGHFRSGLLLDFLVRLNYAVLGRLWDLGGLRHGDLLEQVWTTRVDVHHMPPEIQVSLCFVR